MNGISVIVPSYNSFHTIGYTLDSLERQAAGTLKEILVMDSSDDGRTPQYLEKRRSNLVRVILLSQKTMPAVARNLGAIQAAGTLLIFIDSDAYAAEDWLEKIEEAFKGGCKVGGGAILLPESQKDKQIAAAQYFLQFNEYMQAGMRRPMKFVPSCNLFCEKSLFEKAGGFPEIRASEDVMFGLRVSCLEKLWFLPEARVYHIFREEMTAFFRNQELLGRYVIYYRKKVYTSLIYRGAVPVLLFPAILLVKLVRITVRICRGGFGPAWKFVRALPLFIVGLYFWSTGFIKGSLRAET